MDTRRSGRLTSHPFAMKLREDGAPELYGLECVDLVAVFARMPINAMRLDEWVPGGAGGLHPHSLAMKLRKNGHPSCTGWVEEGGSRFARMPTYAIRLREWGTRLIW